MSSLGVFPLPPFIEVDPRMSRPFVQGDVARYVGDIVAVVVTESRTPAWTRPSS